MGEDLRRTPLVESHRNAGAKMVGFAGWEMPVQYPTGQLKEHEIVRTDAGIFDVSHMGRYWITGHAAFPFIQRLITNDIDRITPGQLLYTPICLESGGIIDDVTCYRFEDGVMMVANASNRTAVWDWLQQHATTDVTIRDDSDARAQIALQGPRAQERLAPLADHDLESIGYYRYAGCRLNGVDGAVISRNGYTGEDGFEIYCPQEAVAGLWGALLDQGARPTGLGARDTLRMEMCYCLYGNELDRETTPLEAGLAWTVRLKKGDFIGRDALARQKKEGLDRTLVGFEVSGKRSPRHGQSILHDGRRVGVVTSGAPCPSLGRKGMGLGYVPPAIRDTGTTLAIDLGGKTIEAVIVERPFYKNGSHR